MDPMGRYMCRQRVDGSDGALYIMCRQRVDGSDGALYV